MISVKQLSKEKITTNDKIKQEQWIVVPSYKKQWIVCENKTNWRKEKDAKK